MKLFLVAALIAFAIPADADSKLYSVSSKAQGASFDLVVTETKRTANKSYLSVPGFSDRTAPGSRWLMCAYTDLAAQRGFAYWTVVYPANTSDELVIGLAHSTLIPVEAVLGEDYDTDHVLGDSWTPVEQFFPMCGMRRNQ